MLGTIDQANRRVFYNPFGGFAGADSFRFSGLADGLTSTPATVSLNVIRRVTDADGDGFAAGLGAGQDCNDANPRIGPSAREIRGNRVDENCDGRKLPFLLVAGNPKTTWSVLGSRLTLIEFQIRNFRRGMKAEARCLGKRCKFKRVRLKGRPRRGVLNALKSLKRGKRTMRAGQTLEVRVSQAKHITRVTRYKLRANKIPSSRQLCLPPGKRKPRRC